MQVRAVAKYIRVQPRKVRIVANECRGLTAEHASNLLRFHPSKSAYHLRKVLESAIANAQENNGVSREDLKISTIMVDEGPRMKRIQTRSMGRANRIIKKTSHITVVLEDFEAKAPIKPHGTKEKPRPSLAALAKKASKKAAAPAAEAPVEEEVKDSAPVEAAEETATVEAVETPVAEAPESAESNAAEAEGEKSE